MTRPSEVLVQVADLEAIKDWWYDDDVDDSLPTNPETKHAFYSIFDVIPEPEWEITDEMRAKYRRAFDKNIDGSDVEAHLRALHREGLIP